MIKKLQIGVKAIIVNGKDESLLIKRTEKYGDRLKDMWDIPGGRINVGEEPEDGLRREVQEELGNLRFKIDKPVHVDSVVNDSERHIVRITYLCSYIEGNIILSDEHSDYSWFKKGKLPDKIDRLAKEAITLGI